MKHGKGKYVKGDGSNFYYDGDWKYNMRHGQGVQQEKSLRYEGHFHRDKKQGEGTIYFGSGETFTGQFKNGKKNGQGKMVWSTEVFFEGMWKDDQMLDGVLHKNGKEYQINKDQVKQREVKVPSSQIKPGTGDLNEEIIKF